MEKGIEDGGREGGREGGVTDNTAKVHLLPISTYTHELKIQFIFDATHSLIRTHPHKGTETDTYLHTWTASGSRDTLTHTHLDSFGDWDWV